MVGKLADDWLAKIRYEDVTLLIYDWKNWEKPRKSSLLNLTSFGVEIWIQDLQNTKQECYSLVLDGEVSVLISKIEHHSEYTDSVTCYSNNYSEPCRIYSVFRKHSFIFQIQYDIKYFSFSTALKRSCSNVSEKTELRHKIRICHGNQ